MKQLILNLQENSKKLLLFFPLSQYGLCPFSYLNSMVNSLLFIDKERLIVYFNNIKYISGNTTHYILSKYIGRNISNNMIDVSTQTNISKNMIDVESQTNISNMRDVATQTENISFEYKNNQSILPQNENNLLDINSNEESNIIDISYNENIVLKKDNILDITSFKIKDKEMNIPGSYLESYDDDVLYDYIPDHKIPGTYLESYDNINDNLFIKLERSFKYFYNFIKPSKKNEDEIDYLIKDKELLNDIKEISRLQEDVYNHIPTYKMPGQYPNVVYYENLLKFNENTPILNDISDLYSNIFN
uniref:Uncharacterized protein n=1 Tax=Clavaria fumosa TaxID=264083 RepID=A0A7T3U587_9AGAR|nr:hypothetical protein KQ422_mgp037 [Clavaria fumosa]QPZ51163.1 hypothetical protein [Clavaria fumosa]